MHIMQLGSDLYERLLTPYLCYDVLYALVIFFRPIHGAFQDDVCILFEEMVCKMKCMLEISDLLIPM